MHTIAFVWACLVGAVHARRVLTREHVRDNSAKEQQKSPQLGDPALSSHSLAESKHSMSHSGIAVHSLVKDMTMPSAAFKASTAVRKPPVTAGGLKTLPKHRACFFDFDGTIADSEDLHRRSFARVLKVDISPETWEKECVGHTELENLEKMRRAGESRSTETLIAERQQLLETMIEAGELVLTPGIHELLQDLKNKGVRNAVVSSNSRNFISKALKASGLSNYFEMLVCGDDEIVQGRTKPNPFPYLHAAEVMDIDPNHCVVMEDSLPGITSGLNAGMPVVAITSQTTPQLADVIFSKGVAARIKDFHDSPRSLFEH